MGSVIDQPALLYMASGATQAVKVFAIPSAKSRNRNLLAIAMRWSDAAGEPEELRQIADVLVSNLGALAANSVIDAKNAARAVLDRVVREHGSHAQRLELLFLDHHSRQLYQNQLGFPGKMIDPRPSAEATTASTLHFTN